MSASPQFPRVPQRVSLVSQTAAVLREGVSEGLWGPTLPGEATLYQQFKVSRVTLRAALKLLESEGLLSGSQGARRKVRDVSKTSVPIAETRTVGLVTPIPAHQLSPSVMFWIDGMREHLAAAGYRLELHVIARAYAPRCGRVLADLMRGFPIAGWVIYLSTPAMQRWFMERELPCVLAGSRHPGIRLPSVDIDYHAACFHAAGLFHARGHRCQALLNASNSAAGDRESEQGFLERVNKTPGLEGLSVYHDGTARGVCQKLDQLLHRPQPPTAFLVSRPMHALTAAGHLIRRGVRLPQDAVLVARDHEYFLDHAVPSIACYRADPVLFARKISRVVLSQLGGRSSQTLDYRLMPEFLRGETGSTLFPAE